MTEQWFLSESMFGSGSSGMDGPSSMGRNTGIAVL